MFISDVIRVVLDPQVMAVHSSKLHGIQHQRLIGMSKKLKQFTKHAYKII